jgi:hypothetical protein
MVGDQFYKLTLQTWYPTIGSRKDALVYEVFSKGISSFHYMWYLYLLSYIRKKEEICSTYYPTPLWGGEVTDITQPEESNAFT